MSKFQRQRRTVILSVRLTPQEAAELRQAAETDGCCDADIIRAALHALLHNSPAADRKPGRRKENR